MAFRILVANPSTYERSDYVEVELGALGVPDHLDETNLKLSRVWGNGAQEEAAYQVDYPFGQNAKHRTLTFFSRDTPSGPDDYSQPTAEYLLEETAPGAWSQSPAHDLWVEHYSKPNVRERTWQPDLDTIGVKLGNAAFEAYFSLVARPEHHSKVNYVGAATNVMHYRADRNGCGEMLSPFWGPHKDQARWGQLTHIELYPAPWDRRWYQTESLIGEPGNESQYTLSWSKSGPLRAIVSLKSDPISIRFVGEPFFKPDEKEFTCYLYRVVAFYPDTEFYTEQLFLRPEGEEIAAPDGRLSYAFRAHFYSYVDYPHEVTPTLARLENVPDYFAVWRDFAQERRGYAFASDSHVRKLGVNGSEIRWRLQLGHEHRCVHLFPFHAYPENEVNPLHEVGHTAWYEWLYKPLQSVPLNRYLIPPQK